MVTAPRSDVLVYLSGPISPKNGYTAEENIIAALRQYLALARRGVVSFAPHLAAAFPTAWTTLNYTEWMAYDLAALDQCTHVLMLPRWDTSSGAMVEKLHAQERGIPIFYSLTGLLAAIEGKHAPMKKVVRIITFESHNADALNRQLALSMPDGRHRVGAIDITMKTVMRDTGDVPGAERRPGVSDDYQARFSPREGGD